MADPKAGSRPSNTHHPRAFLVARALRRTHGGLVRERDMADLKVLEKDGWEELDDVEDAIKQGALDIKKLWASVGQADTAQAALTLFEAGFDLDDVEVEDVKDVSIISIPDDILGEHYRIWVKLRR
jgi:hypothetical protein